MLKHKWFVIRAVVFAILLAILVSAANSILVPKKYFDNMWPTTSTYKGFYQMQQGTVDVLFFGSSHAASGFNPQIFYDSYGIRSYNLSCEQQNMLVTYYWLAEALRYQNPKVVVLDPYVLFDFNRKEALNTQESCTRMAMDPMRWSENKYNAVSDICTYDDKQSFISYIFKNIRFHERWMELGEQDFSSAYMERHYELKGYAPLSEIGKYITIDYVPLGEYFTEECEEFNPLMEMYLDKIVSLCKEQNIDLMFVKTPSNQWFQTRHNRVQEYADDKGLTFIDFNDRKYYDDCGFVFREDMHDIEHSNIWGARKLSVYLGDLINERADVSGKEDEQWSATSGYYDMVARDCALKHIDNIDEYFNAINEDRYTVMIAVKNSSAGFVTDDIRRRFNLLGLEFDVAPGENYCASICEGVRYENAGSETIVYHGSTRNKLVDYCMISGVTDNNPNCSIIMDNKETSMQATGINIVVYDNETWKIIDSMCYNNGISRS